MTKLSNINFELKDVIKLIGFVIVTLGMWYDLKTDLKVFKATTELRLEALEKQTEEGRPKVSYRNREAVLPSEIKIETE